MLRSPRDELTQMLSHYSGHLAHVCLPGGNLGDQLIYLGLCTVLAEYDIKFEEFCMGKKVSGDILFVAGCGGYCRFWPGGLTGLQPYFKSFNKIFILPSTFDGKYEPTKDFLLNLPKNTEVYCRERTSYEFVSGVLGNRAHLSKDTAFYVPWQNYIRQGHGVLHAFRNDKESAHRVKIPKDNIDISIEAKDCEDMLKKISSYDEVHTDRAHVAISASMLRKKVIIYDCGYFKLKAIYDYSLSSLPNTRFVELKKSDLMSRDLDISIVIATHNRYSILNETLEHMERLDRSGINVEFVVVDNNSSDKTEQVINGFYDRLPIRYLFEPKQGQNCARNRALADAPLGKIVVFTDDDIEPEGNWLQTVFSVSQRRANYNVFGGKIYPIWPNVNLPKWTKSRFIEQFGFAAHNYADSESIYAQDQYPSSANFWIRSHLISNGRRFDESIAWHPRNRIMATETIFLQRLSEEGHRMFYCPQAVVGHKVTSEQLSLAYLIKRAYSWGRGMAHIQPLCRRALLDNHPVLWRLIRVGAIVRLGFVMITSLVALTLKKPEKAIRATQWIGYNIESLRIAGKGNDT